MKLRNLFYLLLALPLVFAACEPDNPDTNKPVEKEAVLTLTSDAIMEFEAVGGEGEISYTLENEKEGAKLTAECTAEWVTDLTVGDKVTFTVAANDVEQARDTKITVKYDTKSFEVTVMQAAKQGEEPEPPVVPQEPTEFAPVKVTAMYYDTGNFILNLFGEGNVRHEFDMYDEVNPNDAFLSNGTYTSEDGTIGLGDSLFHNGNGQVGMESAELTLTLNETDWTMTIVGEFASVEGQAHTINWTGVVEGFAYPGQPQNYEATAVKAASTDGINWEITLFECDSFYGEMFSRIVVALPEANFMHVPDGTYSLADGSIVANNGGTSNSFYRYNREADGGAMTECVLNVELDKEAETAKLSGYFVAAGQTINFEWNGAVEGFRYKEIGDEGITEWKNFYIYSQWSKNKCSNVKANSVDGTSINLYVTNNVDPVQHGLGEGTYVVDVWNSTEDRFVEGGESGTSKINGVQIQTGGTMEVQKSGDVYTITINFTDLNGNVYKGVYVGDVPYTDYHDM